jgi:hypothetical protein
MKKPIFNVVIQNPAVPTKKKTRPFSTQQDALDAAYSISEALVSEGLMNRDLPLIHVETPEGTKFVLGFNGMWFSSKTLPDTRVVPEDNQLDLTATNKPEIGTALLENLPNWVSSWSSILNY